MPEPILDLPSQIRTALRSGSAPQRITILAGLFLLVAPPVRMALGYLTGTPVAWSLQALAGLGIRAILIGTATHYMERAGWFSFGASGQD
jgi:hypothetical protein